MSQKPRPLVLPGGMDLSEARRLKPLADENGKLKKLLSDAMLDNAANAYGPFCDHK
jgi:hypothetical protein